MTHHNRYSNYIQQHSSLTRVSTGGNRPSDAKRVDVVAAFCNSLAGAREPTESRASALCAYLGRQKRPLGWFQSKLSVNAPCRRGPRVGVKSRTILVSITRRNITLSLPEYPNATTHASTRTRHPSLDVLRSYMIHSEVQIATATASSTTEGRSATRAQLFDAGL